LAGILSGYGISKDTAVEAAREIHAEDALRAHLQLELGIDADELTSAWAAAFFSALSFLAGAALPMISVFVAPSGTQAWVATAVTMFRSEEHTSELQSRFALVCGLLLEKKTHTG